MAFNLADVLKDVPKLGTDREQIEYISLDLIEEDPNNFYLLSDVENLAANIALCGLQQPIRIRPISGTNNFRIVSGHRRRAALEELRKDDPQRWAEAPCIIEQDDASPALQQLRLIYANANTRTMTSAELSEQAVQVEKLLYQLKEDGYEFPGRMRDHVAQAVGQSKSKLARLKVIRDGLSDLWRSAWEIGDLSESTAYELAKISKNYQDILFEEKQRTGANIKYLYADDVKRFAERSAAISDRSCSFDNCVCESSENRIRKAAVADRYGWFHCSEKCCKDCPDLVRCKNACPKLSDKVARLKAYSKDKAKAEREALEKRNAPIVAEIDKLWRRFGLARDAAGKTVDDVKELVGYRLPPPDEVKRLESGAAKLETTQVLPYGFYFSEISRLIKMADLLGCSLDYLFCRTDVREIASSQNLLELDTGKGCSWHPISVEPPAGVKIIVIDNFGFCDDCVYMGNGLWSGRIDDYEPIRAWSHIPTDYELSGLSFDDSVDLKAWNTGRPTDYGAYATYIQLPGANNKILRELIWTGDEWLMFGNKIDDDVTVCSWIGRPEV